MEVQDGEEFIPSQANAEWYLGQAVQALIDAGLDNVAGLCVGCRMTWKVVNFSFDNYDEIKYVAVVLAGSYPTITALTQYHSVYAPDGSPWSEFTYLSKFRDILSLLLPRTIEIKTIETKIGVVALPADWRSELFEVIRSQGATNQGVTATREGRTSHRHFNLSFGSYSEIRIAEALDRKKVMYLANCLARVNKGGERTNKEPDFLICSDGKWGILEVDGEPFHPPSRTVHDHERDRLFHAHGIRVIYHYDAERCRLEPDQVVSEFLVLLHKNG